MAHKPFFSYKTLAKMPGAVFQPSLRRLLTVSLCLFGLMNTQHVNAATSQTFGDYTVHYNAFNSDVLQPSMAEAYGIVRSKNRGLLSISIIKKGSGPTGKSVRAKVTASGSNLTGQFRKI